MRLAMDREEAKDPSADVTVSMTAVHLRQFSMGSLTRNLAFASAASYFGALSFGYMIGFTSPALPKMTPPSGPLDINSQTMFVTIATIGALLGCPLAGWMVEKVGRKNTLLASGLPFLVGNMLVMASSAIPLLCLGRMLAGISGGMSTVVCPMYLAELSPKELRGMLGSGVQLAITIGILLVYLLGMFCDWRTLAAIGGFIPLVAMVMASYAPETPCFLANQGRVTEAQRVLTWLRPIGRDISEELQEMENSNADKEEKASLLDLIQRPELFRPLCVSAAIMCLQQLTGINIVMFYTVSIFQSAGYERHGDLATVAIGATQVVMTVVACILMDRAGRRVLLSIGGIGMGVSCAALSFYYYSLDSGNAAGLSWLALLSLLVYIIAFSLGWGPIPMLIMSEIFPAKARGSASAVAAITSWTSAFIVTSQYSLFVSIFGMSGTFFFFSAFCFLGVMYVRAFVPETRGKSLEDIELYFSSKTPSRR